MIATLNAHPIPAPARAPAAATRFAGLAEPEASSLSLVAVSTLVIWVLCVLVAALGVALPYSRPVVRAAAAPAVQAEPLHVELADLPAASLVPAGTPGLPSSRAPAAQASLPPAIPVAIPSPAIAFAIPVEGPVQVVEARFAGRSAGRFAASESQTVTPAQSLTFGVGDGLQPAPMYPARALQSRQQGVVGVRLLVDARGQVISAEARQPSPWPLLNAAAVQVVRERWRFRSGQERVYDVAIHFRLKS